MNKPTPVKTAMHKTYLQYAADFLNTARESRSMVFDTPGSKEGWVLLHNTAFNHMVGSDVKESNHWHRDTSLKETRRIKAEYLSTVAAWHRLIKLSHLPKVSYGCSGESLCWDWNAYTEIDPTAISPLYWGGNGEDLRHLLDEDRGRNEAWLQALLARGKHVTVPQWTIYLGTLESKIESFIEQIGEVEGALTEDEVALIIKHLSPCLP